MTTMYLLFQWTEEREAKNHIGIYSDYDKARAAAKLAENLSGDGIELEWDDNGSGGSYTTNTSEDQIYEIEKFEVDVYEKYNYGPGTDNPSVERFAL